MTKETLNLTLTIEAESQTIEAIRQALANDEELSLALARVVSRHLSMQDIRGVELTVTPPEKVSSAKPQAATSPPVVKDGATLVIWDEELNREMATIKIGGRAWIEWLEKEGQSFRYETSAGAYTAVKEMQAGQAVWYAQRQTGDQLSRRQLGPAEALTRRKLWDMAVELSRAT